MWPTVSLRRRRSLRAGATTAVIVALLAGCGSGPSQAGSAAIVGDTAIPLDTIQSQLDYAFGKPELIAQIGQLGAKPSDLGRELVSRSVQQALLTEAARREGIIVGEPALDAAVRAAAGKPNTGLEGLDDPSMQRARIRADLIAAELARRYVDKLAVVVDLVEAPSREEAERNARLIASGPDAARAVFAAAPRAETGRPFRASANPALAASVLFGTPQGRVIYFKTDGGWTILRVVERRTDANPAPGEPPGRQAADLDPESLQLIGLRLVQPLADEIGVRVNPRYGVWDQLQLRAVSRTAVAGAMLPSPTR